MRPLHIQHFWLGSVMTKMNTLEMTAGNVFNLQNFEQDNFEQIKFEQKSFDDFIGKSFVLVDADLLLIRMNKFQLCFCFHLGSCPVLPAMLIISRGECTLKQRGTTVHIFALLPQFPITIFTAKLVRLHGVVSFQNGDMSCNLWLLMRKCNDIIFMCKWVIF